jgi:hypothetical protein
MKETPRSNAKRRAHGFSTAWRQGENTEAYRDGWDDIFGKKKAKRPEPEPEEKEDEAKP